MKQINSFKFYYEWSGHPINDLHIVLNNIKQQQFEGIIYLAGDSSLDNKYWLQNNFFPSINSYENILPKMKKDVCYNLNYILKENQKKYVCINTAVEASTLRQRELNLLDHDKFIRDNITNNDILVVSIGGNDIVLNPKPETIMAIFWLTKFSCISSIQKRSAFFLSTLKNLFLIEIQRYIYKLVEKQRPKKIIVCGLYYPSIKPNLNSWAQRQLSLLGYDKNPLKLQTLINLVFEDYISKIEINGTQVIPLGFHYKLDGVDDDDYIQRVEPSIQGGFKMAQEIFQLI